MKEENEKKSTITFGELLERMQERSDRLNEKRGLPKRKIEPFISEEPQTRVTMKSGILKYSEVESEVEKEVYDIFCWAFAVITFLGFILVILFIPFRVYKLFANYL